MTRIPRSLGFDRFSGLYLWAVFIVVFSIWIPYLFPTGPTVHSIASDQAISALLALAVLAPLICGAFDLAVAATANLCTIVAVLLINQGINLALSIVIAILVGVVIGAFNGFVVVKLRVNSFIATLGTGSIIAAFQIIVTDNEQPLPPTSLTWSNLTQTEVGGFQVVIFYVLAIALVLWWVTSHTPVGRYLYAIGSSPDAARLSGIRTERYTWLSLVASGGIAGIAGVLYGSLSTPSLTYGATLLLPAFAAAFLGSTQFLPGKFNVWGTLVAIFALATGVKGLQLVTSEQWLSQMFFGIALIAAVAFAVGRQRSVAESRRKRLSRRGRDGAADDGSSDGADGTATGSAEDEMPSAGEVSRSR